MDIMGFNLHYRPKTYWINDNVRTEYPVVIVRINMLKTHFCESIVITATRKDGRIFYKVSDDYNTDFFLNFEESDIPLSFAEIIHLIDSTSINESCISGLFDWYYINQIDKDGLKESDFTGASEVTSEFYPQLTEYYKFQEIEWILNTFIKE